MPGRENALCIVVDRIFYAPHSTIFILFILGGFLNTAILSLDIVFKYEGMKIHLKMIGCLKVRPQKSLVQAHILACCQKFKFRPVQNKAYNLNRFEFMPMPSSWKTIFINSCIARTAKKMWMIHISLVLPSDFYLVDDDVVKHAIFHLASADLRL